MEEEVSSIIKGNETSIHGTLNEVLYRIQPMLLITGHFLFYCLFASFQVINKVLQVQALRQQLVLHYLPPSQYGSL